VPAGATVAGVPARRLAVRAGTSNAALLTPTGRGATPPGR